MIDAIAQDPTGYALASCDISGKIIEIEDTCDWFASHGDAEAALKVGGYVQMTTDIWNGTTTDGQQIYARIVHFA